MEKKPLVIGTSGSIEQLQPGDCLGDTVTPEEYNRLRHQLRKLVEYLLCEELDIPESIIEEFDL